MATELLKNFLLLRIGKAELENTIGQSAIKAKTGVPIVISARDVLYALELYSQDKINLAALLEWCDVIRFSDLFDYPDEENELETIASVVDEIQELELLDFVNHRRYYYAVER